MTRTQDIIKSLPLLAAVLGKKYGVEVRIGGTSAFTNGKVIQLPDLPSEGDDTLLMLVRGMTDHESAHIRFTDFDVLVQEKPSPVLKHIWNSLEDAFVEHRLAALYPGCLHNFRRLIEHFFSKEDTEVGDSSPAFAILNATLLTLRAWDAPLVIPHKNQAVALVQTAYPGLWPKIDALLRTAKIHSKSSKENMDFAKRIVQLMEEASQTNTKGNPRAFVGQALEDLLTNAASCPLPQQLGEKLQEAVQNACTPSTQSMRVAIPRKKTISALSTDDLTQCRTATHTLRLRLTRLLQAAGYVPSRLGMRGKLCGACLHKLAVNNPKVFLRQEEQAILNTAVHILVDSSGSMAGANINLAVQACYAVASALYGIKGVNVAVTAFPGIGGINAQTVSPLLEHGQKLHTNMRVAASGGTPTGEALWSVLQQMASLNEERKIILLLTDGDPNEYDIVKNALATAQSCGFEVYGIGIGVESLSALMPETSCNIQNIQELAPAMFGMLQTSLIKNLKEKK